MLQIRGRSGKKSLKKKLVGKKMGTNLGKDGTMSGRAQEPS